MKKLFLSSFIIITSFFFVNNVKAENVYSVSLDELHNVFMSDSDKALLDNSVITYIDSIIEPIKDDNYYVVVYGQSNNDVNIAYWSKSFLNSSSLYLSFYKTLDNSKTKDCVSISVSINQSGDVFSDLNSIFSIQYDFDTNTSYGNSFLRNKSILLDLYYLSDLSSYYNHIGKIYDSNCTDFRFKSFVSNSSNTKIDRLVLCDSDVCFYDDIVYNTILFDSYHNFVLEPVPKITTNLTKNFDDFNNVLSEDLSFSILNYSSKFTFFYKIVSSGDDPNNYIWLPIIINPLFSSGNVHIDQNGKLYISYLVGHDGVYHDLYSLNIFSISSIDMISLDITNTEGIVLIPNARDNLYSSNLYFSAPKEFIDQYKSNPNFYFKYSNRSLHLANVNNFDINDLFSQEKLINNFSPGDSLTEIIDKNNYNISLFRAEKPDYIVSNDRPMIISFDRNVYNYQVLGENGSDNDNTTIIDPNTGKPIVVDSFKETDFFTLMKHAFSRFKSVVRNIFKLVSTFFYSLPSSLNYYFVLIMFFIILLLFLKFLI